MLEGDELEKAIANIMKRLRSVNLLYIRKIAMQIRKIGDLGQSSINRLVAMAEMNADIGEIKDRLRIVSAVNTRELQGIFTRAMNETYTDPRFRRYLAKYPLKNTQRQRIERYVQTVYRQTAANMYNYSNTTAITQGYMDAIDRAAIAVSTGVASYTEAMRDTVRELGTSGMKVVYESGYRRRLDTAVRQNIVDAVNQINKNASLMLGEELGYDAVEISAHAMSAPDHEPVQGHVFLLAEFQQMQAGSPFRDIDGNVFAGFRRPIGEWNCRHTPMSFSTQWSKRKWTDEQLRQFIDDNHKGCTINGKHKTLYEAMQMMRDIETAVRREKDTAVAAQAAGDTILRQECQRNINALVRRYAEVSAASGAAERRNRMTVEGFRAVKTPPDNQAAVGSPQPPQNGLTNGGESGMIETKGQVAIRKAFTFTESTKPEDVADAIIKNHKALSEFTPESMKAMLEGLGFTLKALGKKSKMLHGVPFEEGGGYRIDFLWNGYFQYHPENGSHHHKTAYWRISCGERGDYRYDMDGEFIPPNEHK